MHPEPRVAIVDYGLGNLYSIRNACALVGLEARITTAAQEILAADAVILPGVGAYGDAMRTLRSLDLDAVIRDVAQSQRLLIGICLGMQLLMSESSEFGHHQGLGIIDGEVVKFDSPQENGRILKVPQIRWNSIHQVGGRRDIWAGTLLQDIEDGEPMYFVHSYIVRPRAPETVLSMSAYGDIAFCSSLQRKNVFACQFHPERSGDAGIKIYRNLAARLRGNRE